LCRQLRFITDICANAPSFISLHSLIAFQIYVHTINIFCKQNTVNPTRKRESLICQNGSQKQILPESHSAFLLVKIRFQIQLGSEQFHKAGIYTPFGKNNPQKRFKNGAGEGIRTPASQRPTGWLVFGTGPVCAHMGSRGQRDNHSATPAWIEGFACTI
jgi:hypothetical protein